MRKAKVLALLLAAVSAITVPAPARAEVETLISAGRTKLDYAVTQGLGPEFLSFIARGCTDPPPEDKRRDGIVDVLINVSQFKGQKLRVYSRAPLESYDHLVGPPKPPHTLIHFGVDCEPISYFRWDKVGAITAEPGRPATWVSDAMWVRIAHTRETHIDEGYELYVVTD